METIRARGPEAEEAERRYKDAVAHEVTLKQAIDRLRQERVQCHSMALVQKHDLEVEATMRELEDCRENIRFFLKMMRGEIAPFSVSAQYEPPTMPELVDSYLAAVAETGRPQLTVDDLSRLSGRHRDMWTMQLDSWYFLASLKAEINKTEHNLKRGAFKHAHGFKTDQVELLAATRVYVNAEIERTSSATADAMYHTRDLEWMSEGRTCQPGDEDADVHRENLDRSKNRTPVKLKES